MKKLITLLAIVLTVQCVAQENDSIHFNIDDRYRRIRDTIPLVDTCPEGTTWMHGLKSSGCEVEAGCYTQEQKRENYEWFYKCRKEDEGRGGITALKSLDDFTVIADGKIITGKLDENKSNNVIIKFYNGLETPITIEDIERWIKHCKNDSIEIGIRYYYEDGTYRDVLYPKHRLSGPYSPKKEYIYKSKDPNNIVGLLKWLKERK